MTPRFKTIYKEQVLPNLAEKLNYQNCHQLPKLEKIQLNRGLGLSAQNSNILKKSIEEFRAITGQKPITKYNIKFHRQYLIFLLLDLSLLLVM